MNNGTGKIKAQINQVGSILKKFGFLEQQNPFPKNVANPIELSKTLPYEKLWEFYISNLSYFFLLKDSSILWFDITNTCPTFIYFSCPYVCKTYSDFLLSRNLIPKIVGDSYLSDYEIYLTQCLKNENPVSIRYDYDPISYREGIHPCSHLHIGMDNDIRLGLKTILNPLSFALIVLRQLYPFVWSQLLIDKSYENLLKSYKSKMIKIEKKYYKSKDDWEHYLI